MIRRKWVFSIGGIRSFFASTNRTDPGRMTKPGKTLLLLGLIQALHSSEEILFHLHDFAGRAAIRIPAFLQGIVRPGVKPEIFSVVNIAVTAALLATVPFYENRRPWAVRLAWVWAVAEALNGLFHPAAAAVQGRYVPGAATGPFLLLTASVLLIRLYADGKERGPVPARPGHASGPARKDDAGAGLNNRKETRMHNPKMFRIAGICFMSAALLWFYAGLLGRRAVLFVLGWVFMMLGGILLFRSGKSDPKK
jgi:hypothetical protein